MTDQNVNITVDGTPVTVPAGTLVWEAAKSADTDIPIFCYHSKLGPVGVCRMCMVEIEGQPKLTTACTTGVTDGMVIRTRTPEVEKAQRGVLEFLLINHPLDCPICDRAGECPLQDQTYAYGPGVSRFIERKRHYLKPVHLGPTIDLDRERCILCWRCVRFTSEVANDSQLILVDRGSETYIGTYESQPYESDFSGNVIELCPVGALTSRKQRFTFRPWELTEHSSICPHCPMGCNIQIDVRDAQEVIRFRSRTNDDIDDGWLCDRGRFGYEFITSPDRLKTPLIRDGGNLRPTSWSQAYRVIAENMLRVTIEHGSEAIAGIASAGLPNEDLFVFRRFMNEVVGSSATDYWPRPDLGGGQDTASATIEALTARIVPIKAVDNTAVIVVVETDPGEREPVMELRIRKAVNKRGVTLIEVGSKDISLTPLARASLRCERDQVVGLIRSLTMQDVTALDFPQLSDAREILRKAKSVIVIYEDALPHVSKESRADVLAAINGLVETLDGEATVGVIPMLRSANEMAARDFGLATVSGNVLGGEPAVQGLRAGAFRAAIVAGCDPVGDERAVKTVFQQLDFLVVTALFENETTAVADVVLPAASFAERVGTFTNTSRQVQVFAEAVPSPGIARPEWQMLIELSQRWDKPLEYSMPEHILADIAANVPGYRNLMPTSYDVVSGSLSVSGGVEAAE